jgi:calcineurin-like phosphoesterase family protein
VKYSFRPGWFEKNYDKHNELMWGNWLHMIRPHETVLHLGDLCMWKRMDEDKEEMLRQLTGNKFIVLGNHDNKPAEWYEDKGFTVVEPFSQKVKADSGAEFEVFFDHYPKKVLRDLQASIYGHCHNNPHTATARHLNVSCELWGLAPIPYEAAIKKVLYSVKA